MACRACWWPVLIGATLLLFDCSVQTVGDGVRGQEMAAIRTLATLNTAQTQYFSTYGRYATSLAELAPPPGGASPTASAADLIPTSLVLGVKSGYKFTMVGSPQGYAVNAEPQVFNATGKRSFFTNQSTVIREHTGNEPASVTDPEIK